MTPLADFEWLEALKFDHFCNDRVYGDIDLAYTMSMQSNPLLEGGTFPLLISSTSQLLSDKVSRVAFVQVFVIADFTSDIPKSKILAEEAGGQIVAAGKIKMAGTSHIFHAGLEQLPQTCLWVC